MKKPLSEERRDAETTDVSPRPLGSSEQLQKGDLFASRYEVMDRIHDDGILRSYNALDVKTNHSVLLSVLAAALLPNANERSHVVERLKMCTKKGDSTGFLDAGYEGSRVYTVERHPGGVPLRNVLRARASKAQRYRMQELVGFLAPLVEALESNDDPEPHGSIRADVVWVDLSHTAITGWHLTRVLPIARLRRALKQDRALGLAFAPEVSTGAITKAADRYGVAVLVYEALTGRLPDPDAKPITSLELVGEALSHYLRREAARRPESLRPLLQTIREQAAEELAVYGEAPAPTDELFSTKRKAGRRMYSEDTFPRAGIALPPAHELGAQTPEKPGQSSRATASRSVWVVALTFALVTAAIILGAAYLASRSIGG